MEGRSAKLETPTVVMLGALVGWWERKDIWVE